ncbi:MAG: hypothetical protein ACI9F9_002232 [Candidatus Paceibacteria bacterium]|jgi:hypothetical protein
MAYAATMKCLMKLVAIGVLLVLLLVGGVVVALNPMLSKLVGESVTYATQQETTVESIDLGLLSGDFSIGALSIANSEGFQEQPLMTLHSFKAKLDPSKVTGDIIPIDLVEIDGLDLALEMKGTDSNVTALLLRLRELQQRFGADAAEGESDEDATPNAELPEEAGPRLDIQRIRIAGIRASLTVSEVPLANGVYELEVPDLILENFNSDMAGATSSEWTAYVLENVLTQSLAAGNGKFPAEWQGFLSGEMAAGGLLDGDINELDERAKERLNETLDDLIQQGKQDPQGLIDDLGDSEKKLKALFGGKQ